MEWAQGWVTRGLLLLEVSIHSGAMRGWIQASLVDLEIPI